eukprot:CAMPEP_0181499310 /NCGR_PEP_ID=MMETSP1110-20121109/54587_1 /TAXON_ID=174948 /ORGANISM="Symbiodinium sp., Strain CCMP421" /LENGTH=169 /DNA_ID=CAMNT_0023627481 /DNA_START=254 /DNA_END=760 /DNA_ORIENTATION=-
MTPSQAQQHERYGISVQNVLCHRLLVDVDIPVQTGLLLDSASVQLNTEERTTVTLTGLENLLLRRADILALVGQLDLAKSTMAALHGLFVPDRQRRVVSADGLNPPLAPAVQVVILSFTLIKVDLSLGGNRDVHHEGIGIRGQHPSFSLIRPLQTVAYHLPQLDAEKLT